ncbi:MAG: squalene synthase HpnC [Elusimicrobia bacterium]|nr:squalene synthase HpnC [Elusimicrobiota bacterium]
MARADLGVTRASSLDDAYSACLNLCRSHDENFPVASFLLPAHLRRPVAAVYAFARIADDFADEPGRTPEDRLKCLADWRRRLRDCRRDHEAHPVFWALSDTLTSLRLPLEPFDRLITAFEMDVTKNRYASFQDLLFYCRHSANPVGELVLRICGEWNEERGKWSDDICTALQLANFWQDMAIDAPKGRLYVPQEDVKSMGLSEDSVLRGAASEELRELMAFQVDRTWSLFLRGRPLCDDVTPALRRELRFIWLGGTRILEKIQEQKWDVWSRRPKLKKRDWLGLVPRWILWRS